jgi:transcriptional regulator with XRE-family HTH domain
MSNTPTNTSVEPRDMSFAFRKARETVLRMLSVIEDPDSTTQETRRACSTIRAAIEVQDDPNRYGVNLGECELSAMVANPSVDRLAEELDSQEAAFAEKLRQFMKARGVTQRELASRIGCTQPAISQMLKRECRPQKKTILGLATALNVDPRDLWPDLDVTDILDTVAAVQQEQTMLETEAEVFRRALERPAPETPAAPLPKRKR